MVDALEGLVVLVGFLLAWHLVQVRLLPRLGVPT